MALLSVVLALAAPSLGRFFRGRGLDTEAHRLLALTRYAQNRAVYEGIPMILWIDEDERRYGLQAEFSYSDLDERAVEFEVNPDVSLEVAPPTAAALRMPRVNAPASTSPNRDVLPRDLPLFRFTPDGFVADTSPEWVRLFERRDEKDGAALWVARSRNRLTYELRPDEPPPLDR